MLFRRLAAACAQNVRPFARRVPTEAIANVTMRQDDDDDRKVPRQAVEPVPLGDRTPDRPAEARDPDHDPGRQDDRDRERDGRSDPGDPVGPAGGLIRGGRHAQPDQRDGDRDQHGQHDDLDRPIDIGARRASPR